MSKIRYVKEEEWGTTFPNFRKEEFKCLHGVGEGISFSLLQVLQEIRNNYGAVNITSGYRCPSCNASVGGDPNSWHLRGFACDFYLGDGRLNNQEIRIGICEWIRRIPNVHYVYCNINGNFPNMGSCIHVDTYPIYEEEIVSNEPIKEDNSEDIKDDKIDDTEIILNNQDKHNPLVELINYIIKLLKSLFNKE